MKNDIFIDNFNLINKFKEIYKDFKEEDSEKDNESYFKLLCFKFNFFYKLIPINFIPDKSNCEAVIIEFGVNPYFEFLLRNNIFKLGKKWAFTIICGNNNFNYIESVVNIISNRIKIIKCNKSSLSENEYNLFLTNKSFWSMLSGEKILLLNSNIFINYFDFNSSISYDFLQNFHFFDKKNSWFSLSLRSKSVMLKIINSKLPNECPLVMEIKKYMKENGLDIPPEAYYFYTMSKHLSIGNLPSMDESNLFCSIDEWNSKCCSCINFWKGNDTWKKYFLKKYNIVDYSFTSDIDLYLKFLNLDNSYNKNKQITNAFDVDLFFCKKINNLNLITKEEILRYIQVIAMEGIIYHPKQLINIFPSIKFINFLNEVIVTYKNNIYLGQSFVSKYLYNNSYNNIVNYLIKQRYINFNSEFPLLILVFIGNQKKGKILVDYLIRYTKIQNCNIAFCFNINNNIDEKFKLYIKENLEHYAVYEAKEFGTDITPTFLMYDDICKKYTFNHIIKLHSKTIEPSFTDLTNFLLDKPLKQLVLYKNPICHCIGPKSYYIKVNKDKFNNDLKIRFLNSLKINNEFVSGTIFYCNNKVFKACLQFFVNYYKIFLFNNLYENNSINLNNSPIHFLERLFGCIKY